MKDVLAVSQLETDAVGLDVDEQLTGPRVVALFLCCYFCDVASVV